jgi:hypothetical protein
VGPPAEAPIIAAFNLSPQMRGVTETPSVVIPAEVDFVTLQLELDMSEHAAYRAELKAASRRQPVWTSGRLRPYDRNGDRIVAVSFRPRLLQAQAYVIELAGIASSGVEEPFASYAFRVIRR